MQYAQALDYIIRNKQIRTVFQPILSMRDGSVLGHEALSRITCESVIKGPDKLFRVAEEENRLWELEQLCRTTALESAYKFLVPPYSKKLFINVNPLVIHDDKFKKGFTKSFLEQYNITPSNVVFEITERIVISDMSGFKSSIEHYKSQNYKIAIDDAGAGYSGLNLISDVNPNYLKLDMNLIRNIDKDSIKYALVKGMVEFSKVSNIYLIAEGIETVEELETLINLGVQYGQGYFIQRPHELISDINPEVLNIIVEKNRRKNHNTQWAISSLYIKNLCIFMDTINPDEMIPSVYEKLNTNPNCYGFCVTVDNKPIGIVTRDKLTHQLSGHYGFSLNQNKKIYKIMDTNFLSVDSKTPVSVVSNMAMSRPDDKLYDFIVVTEDCNFIGVVTIKDLLQKTTEQEVSRAKDLNPLTGLPGNQIIEKQLIQCIDHDRQYSVAYLDLDNFKAYNDVYGFENGDMAIRLLSKTMKKYLTDDQFIGHIGGDDFLAVLDKQVDVEYFDNIISEFQESARELYNQTDRDNGFIISKNRSGAVEKFPLLSVTVVLVNNRDYTFKNVSELSGVLAGMKTMAKQFKRSMFKMDFN